MCGRFRTKDVLSFKQLHPSHHRCLCLQHRNFLIKHSNTTDNQKVSRVNICGRNFKTVCSSNKKMSDSLIFKKNFLTYLTVIYFFVNVLT